MLPLVLATILSLPMYPLNPTEQDTLNFTNLHISAGIAGPAAMISPGPEISIKYEQLYDHPFLFRLSMDYRYGRIESLQYPEGAVHRNKFILEAIYYRGTDDMTAYIGVGPVIEFNSLDEDDASYEKLGYDKSISDIDMTMAFGYHLTLGLRIKEVYSIEVGITEISPSFIYHEQFSPTSFTETRTEFRASDVKVTFGYILPLKL